MRWDQYEDKLNFYLKSKWDNFCASLVELYKRLTSFILKKINEITNIDFKKLITETKDKVKNSTYKLAHYLQDHYYAVPKRVAKKFNKIKSDTRNYYSFAAIALFFFSINQAYKNYRLIVPADKPKRNISSEQIKRRPAYYNNEKKLIKIYNINVPVLNDENKKTKSIVVNLSVQLSNRFSKEVLESLHHELNDYINMDTRPIVKDFPLSDEGKKILKNKLHSSLQDLLNKKKINAEVKNVYITSILSS